MKIPTMTAHELRQRLNDLGVKMSHEAMATAIEQGLFPFAQVYRLPGSKKRKFLIYTAQFEAWAREHAASNERT